MCGIGGYAGQEGGQEPDYSPDSSPDRALDDALADAFLGQLAHRGPDHRQSARLRAADGTPVLLAFTRLSILDLSPAGHQPMATEDGALHIVYNGETYNFAALRRELEARGHRFRSTSDTEVVLRGYREWGEAVLDRMRGMFAFALWDAQAQTLLLARDRLGIKPLYYRHDGRRLSFGSELRTLLAAGAPRRLDPRAVHGYLALGSVPQPGTILEGVSLLLPGRLLRVAVRGGRAEAPIERRYFTLPPPAASAGEPPRTLAQATTEIAPVLEEAVRLRLIADVPVGVLLSGGVDSTAVAVLARRGAQDLDTFTLSYGDGAPESEGAEARRVAGLLGTRHHEHTLASASILGRVPAYLDALDQPSVDGLNTYLVAEQVRAAGLKVALSGLGGDEVFLGYALPRAFAAPYRMGALLPRLPWRLAARLLRAPGLGFSPLGLQKGLTLALGSAADRARRARSLYAVLRGLVPAPQLAALCDGDLGLRGLDPADHVRCDPPAPIESLTPLDLVSYLEVDNYLSNTLLRDADVMSMVHGVELRVPLCDHVLVSRALALGAAARMTPGRQKPLLVDACGDALVRQVSERRKQGFVLPLGAYLRGDLRGRLDEVLRDPAAVRAAGLVPAAAARLWDDFLAGRAPSATWRLWALFVLLAWARRHRLAV